MSLPPPPRCQVELAERVLCAFLREETQKVGFQRAVLGLSGGIDSALVVELAARAIGPEQVLAVAMPYRTSHPDSLRLAEESAAHAGVASSRISSRLHRRDVTTVDSNTKSITSVKSE